MYFTQQYLDFFKKLASNNHKAWFDEHRNEYESFVKKPFYNFIEKLFSEISKIELNFIAEPRKSIYRINRDIRFSKDKTPYKIHMSAVISPTGKRGVDEGCFYLEFGPEYCLFGGGVYAPSPEYLTKLRFFLAENSKNFTKTLNEKSFKDFFEGLDDTVDKNKVLPKELKEKAQEFPILFYKRFLFLKKIDAEFILRDDLLEQIIEFYKIAKPVNDLLTLK